MTPANLKINIIILPIIKMIIDISIKIMILMVRREYWFLVPFVSFNYLLQSRNSENIHSNVIYFQKEKIVIKFLYTFFTKVIVYPKLLKYM